MSIRIQYAYLKQQTWLFRRNYPAELQPMLGSAFKQSLKTGDARVAKARAAEVNAKYEEIVTKARAGIVSLKPEPVRVVPTVFAPVVVVGRATVKALAKDYLHKRAGDMKPGGYKSVRYAMGLFVSAVGDRPIGQLGREEAATFVRKVAELPKHAGKSEKVHGYGLDQLIRVSDGETILPQTQKRIVKQVAAFVEWAIQRRGVSQPVSHGASGRQDEGQQLRGPD